MKFCLSTSLLSLVFATAVSGVVYGAPTVRMIGGTNTAVSSSAGTSGGTTTTNSTTARAGSLRSTGGFVRPTTSVGSGTTSGATESENATSGSAVSSGAVGLNRTPSSPQRLSIGKYIGAPRSVSTEGEGIAGIMERIEKLEVTTERMEEEKQDKLSGTDFITIGDDEIWLEFEKLKEALALRDGREVELKTTDDGLFWRYSGEEEWVLLISWDDLKSNLNITDINNSIADINVRITNLVEEVRRIQEVDISGKVDIAQGSDKAGMALVVDSEGNVQATGDFVTPATVTSMVTNITNPLAIDISGKVDIDQGVASAGKALVVGPDGMVTTDDPLRVDDIDISSKLDKMQSPEDAEKVLTIGSDGMIVPGKVVYSMAETDTLLDKKLDNTVDGEEYVGRALVVSSTGELEPTGDFVEVNQGVDRSQRVLTVDDTGHVRPDKIVYSVSETDTLLGGKLDIAQGPESAGKALIVDAEGNIKPSDLDIDLSGKVDVDQGTGKAGKALVVDSAGIVQATGEFLTSADISGKVDIDQGTDKAGKALIVGNDGMVTTGSINTRSLGLGTLAYKDKVKNMDVADDAAIERSKMAADITDTLYWVDRWRNTEPDDNARYVVAVDEYGQKSWFRVE